MANKVGRLTGRFNSHTGVQKAFFCIQRGGQRGVTVYALVASLGVSERTVKRYLKYLERKGTIEAWCTEGQSHMKRWRIAGACPFCHRRAA